MTATPTPTHLDPDTHVYQLYAEYTNQPVELIAECARNFGNFNQVAWQECAGADWQAKAKVFYERSDEYLFDLLYGSQTRAQRREVYRRFGHWGWLERAGRTAMEFGGGLGFSCSLLRELGKQVTYVDVDGPAARFARWYFERTGQDVEVLLTPSDRVVLPSARQWDLVFSDSVIEHVPDPAATVERLAQATAPGGLLYLIIDAHEVSAAFPMHRHVHLEELLAGAPSLRAMEHVLHSGDTLNAFRAPR
ncbi:MAG: class I SAM-dependent methyltransferase [Planctomycetota bacterium]